MADENPATTDGGLSGELGELSALIAAHRPRVVGVDGMNGVGKTSRVARPLARPIISLDDYLLGDGRYLEGVRTADLLRAFAAREGEDLVVEGCCLLAVLEKIGVRPDMHVYVRRITPSGWWDDEEVGSGEDREHQLQVDREVGQAARRLTRDFHTKQSTLAVDLINYHADYRPLQNADLVIDLVEPH